MTAARLPSAERASEDAGAAPFPTPTEAVDGRSARRLRNTDAAVDAILELLAEGCTAPTAQLVAERSGLSIRSIFRLFEDMDALHGAAIARQEARFTSLFHDVPTDGPLAARIAALVANRAELFEAVSPVRRHALRVAPGSPQIRAGLDRTNRRFREQLAQVFAPELAVLPVASARRGDDGPSRTTVLAGLDAATSWESWERLRAVQGLSPDEAATATSFLLASMLAAATAAAAATSTAGARTNLHSPDPPT